MDVWIPMFTAVATGLLSFFAATAKSRSELKKVQIENESRINVLREEHTGEIDRLQTQHALDLEKMEAEVKLRIEEASKTQEGALMNEMIAGLMGQALTNPQKAHETMQGLQKLAEWADNMNASDA